MKIKQTKNLKPRGENKNSFRGFSIPQGLSSDRVSKEVKSSPGDKIFKIGGIVQNERVKELCNARDHLREVLKYGFWSRREQIAIGTHLANILIKIEELGKEGVCTP